MPEYPVRQLTDQLSRATAPSDFHTSARRALDFFDQLQRDLSIASGATLACREGCSLCCWLRVDVFAHEVFLIAHHIQTRFSDTDKAALLSRLANHSEKIRTITPFEHATQNVVCPLLMDGRCSVYPVRPHACRRQHSLEFSACQYTHDHPLDLEFPGAHDRELFLTLSEAMGQGATVYASLGFDTTIYELGTALTEALTEPSAWRRWRQGKKAFLRASVTPSA